MSCEDFVSVRVFDRHRTGEPGYTFAEGLTKEPPREDGRRCLGAAEMRERGLGLDDRGRWYDPVEAARGRARFTDAPVSLPGVAQDAQTDPVNSPTEVAA